MRAFVHALHDVSNGRPPNKVRQAVQVIATAVSHAAALAPSRVTVKEIGDALGLNPRMITKCRARFDALSDCDWEQLFDDRGAERDDKLAPEWKEFARQFWTDEMLADEQGNMYNYVRASEKNSDDIRDPAHRKSDESFRIHWLQENVGVMYKEMVRRGSWNLAMTSTSVGKSSSICAHFMCGKRQERRACAYITCDGTNLLLVCSLIARRFGSNECPTAAAPSRKIRQACASRSFASAPRMGQ